MNLNVTSDGRWKITFTDAGWKYKWHIYICLKSVWKFVNLIVCLYANVLNSFLHFENNMSG